MPLVLWAFQAAFSLAMMLFLAAPCSGLPSFDQLCRLSNRRGCCTSSQNSGHHLR